MRVAATPSSSSSCPSLIGEPRWWRSEMEIVEVYLRLCVYEAGEEWGGFIRWLCSDNLILFLIIRMKITHPRLTWDKFIFPWGWWDKHRVLIPLSSSVLIGPRSAASPFIFIFYHISRFWLNFLLKLQKRVSNRAKPLLGLWVNLSFNVRTLFISEECVDLED